MNLLTSYMPEGLRNFYVDTFSFPQIRRLCALGTRQVFTLHLHCGRSIINGFALPLKEEHHIFLERCLLPLHRHTRLQSYSTRSESSSTDVRIFQMYVSCDRIRYMLRKENPFVWYPQAVHGLANLPVFLAHLVEW